MRIRKVFFSVQQIASEKWGGGLTIDLSRLRARLHGKRG